MTGLRAVSFSKRKASQPRLSPRHGPGLQHERFWTEAERKVLLDGYKKFGRHWCQERLPKRSVQAIYLEADKLGLTTKRADNLPIEERDALDALIKERWPSLSARGAWKAFAKEIGHPRWMISKRAQALGLSQPKSKDNEWSDAEKALLREVPLHDLDKCADIFRARGFHRTATAIKVMCKREGLKRRYRETLSAHAAAEILGLNDKTVTIYCLDGRLKAGRRGTRRLVQQGGDAWAIERTDLRAFVLENLEIIDIRKVEKFAFVDLLVGTTLAEKAKP